MAMDRQAMGVACVPWVAGYGRGVRGAWGASVGGRSPMAMAGGGGEWGPHTKESIKCIPQSGTPKNQKTNLEPQRIKRSPCSDPIEPQSSSDFAKCNFPKNNKKIKKEV